jgi:hypothetical protein
MPEGGSGRIDDSFAWRLDATNGRGGESYVGRPRRLTGSPGGGSVISSDDLRTLAAERQAMLRQEAAVAGLIRRMGARRPVRIVQPAAPRLALVIATVFALTGTLRVEH